ncbi:hypothetical protein [Bradyrhizobium iriomotense]|uniref:Uncharacterized protein n=1 Tax=Bradyrhizobium iriomotense TaxID=441950 RepID=A0ABQ6AQ78_9BRAD|nr:hypothetical protein [Bradyrhizobium iriomotense]GLR84110.1 hypothetical protein GCM10007857_08200 [Bradyrhizobium iriomotense]
MEEFFRFIQQSGRERSRLIREDSGDRVVPSAPVGEQGKKPPGQVSSGINAGVAS